MIMVDQVEKVARAIDPSNWVRIDRWRACAKCYRETPFADAGFQDAESAEALAADCERKADKNAEYSLARARAAINPNERLTAPTDEMIEAGCEAMRKMSDEMLARERSDKPEEMPDYDEGDLCRSIYVAMCAAAQTPQVDSRGSR